VDDEMDVTGERLVDAVIDKVDEAGEEIDDVA